MTGFLVFENAGEMDPRVISTFGVNVKEGEGAIGFFGTGLKYALAILLRTGHAVRIQAGLREFDFHLATQTIRGKPFEFVMMAEIGAGEPVALGFTTELGKTWEPWMAYREIRCNCTDERGEIRTEGHVPSPVAGLTRVVISGPKIIALHEGSHRYFIAGEPTHRLKCVEVHARATDSLFYRGIKVADLPTPSMHLYNVTEDLELTEDRTAKSVHMALYAIARSILACDDPDLIRGVVSAHKDYLEHTLDLDWNGVKPGRTFMEVVGALVRDRSLSINQSARAAYEKHARNVIQPDEVVLTPVERKMLDRASAFCGEMGFPISYPVLVVESLGPGYLGLARDGKIYIAHRVFMQGTKQVASTLIEEYVHLKHSLRDCTRELQTFLFDRVVSLGEELRGDPL